MRRQPSVSQEARSHQHVVMLTSWSWNSSLQNYKTVTFFCLSHPVYGNFLGQLELRPPLPRFFTLANNFPSVNLSYPFNCNGFICKATILKLKTNLSSASDLIVERYDCQSHVKPDVVFKNFLFIDFRERDGGRERERIWCSTY